MTNIDTFTKRMCITVGGATMTTSAIKTVIDDKLVGLVA